MSEWKKSCLGDIAYVQTGPFGSQLKNSQYIHGGIPVVTVEHINNFRIKNFTYPSVSEENKNRLLKYTLIEGDIVFTRVGSVDLSAYVSNECSGWLFSSRMLRVRVQKNVDSKFLSYYFQQKAFRDYILNVSVGATMPSINTQILKSMEVSYPSLPEQKAIASVLSSLDNKIDLLHRQNKTLESMAETLFRQWFVEEVQDDYSDITIETVIETTSGGTPSRKQMEYYQNGNTFWVKSKELNGLFINSTEEKITDEAIKNSSAKLLPKHSILIAMYGATVGEYAVISKPMSCNQAICALKPNDNYPYTYIFMYVKTQKDELINQAVGSAQQNISQALIKKMKVSSNLGLINKYHNTVLHMFEKIEENSKQIQTLEKLRDTLLPKLMSGEVRVNYTPEEIKQ